MKYVASSVSLRYVPSEDRIQLINHCEKGTFVVAFLTRRMLGIILVRLFEWLEKIGTLTDEGRAESPDPTKRRQVHRFEHEAAQYQVRAEQKTISSERILNQFLLGNFGLTALSNSRLMVRLSDEKFTHEVSLGLTFQQLHKIVGELLRISEKVGWQLQNPWKPLITQVEKVSAQTMQ